jgi:hypothetical protein
MGTVQKNKGGRPKIEIDADQVKKLAAMQCTNVEIAAFFNCDEGTIRKRFSDVLSKGRETGKISLRRMQWQSAEKGNTSMLIWLGKQYLGQSDKKDLDPESNLADMLSKLIQSRPD